MWCISRPDGAGASRRPGGRSVWHVIPETAVDDVERLKGTVADERRLFYVALTRAEKYLDWPMLVVLSLTRES